MGVVLGGFAWDRLGPLRLSSHPPASYLVVILCMIHLLPRGDAGVGRDGVR